MNFRGVFLSLLWSATEDLRTLVTTCSGPKYPAGVDQTGLKMGTSLVTRVANAVGTVYQQQHTLVQRLDKHGL